MTHMNVNVNLFATARREVETPREMRGSLNRSNCASVRGTQCEHDKRRCEGFLGDSRTRAIVGKDHDTQELETNFLRQRARSGCTRAFLFQLPYSSPSKMRMTVMRNACGRTAEMPTSPAPKGFNKFRHQELDRRFSPWFRINQGVALFLPHNMRSKLEGIFKSALKSDPRFSGFAWRRSTLFSAANSSRVAHRSLASDSPTPSSSLWAKIRTPGSPFRNPPKIVPPLAGPAKSLGVSLWLPLKSCKGHPTKNRTQKAQPPRPSCLLVVRGNCQLESAPGPAQRRGCEVQEQRCLLHTQLQMAHLFFCAASAYSDEPAFMY